MSDPAGLAIAQRLIAEEAEKQTGFLDLGMLGLTRLPDEMRNIPHLKRLNIGFYYIDDQGRFCRGQGGVSENIWSPDFARWEDLANLEKLWATYLAINDLSPLAQLPSLQFLNCSSTPVSDLSPLAQFPSLQSLSCSSTSVSDLSPLAQLPSLQSLICSSTPVSDLSPLAQLPSLQSLSCSYTSVNDLSPLAQLPSLQSLYCSSTPVSDLAPLGQLPKLRSLDCNDTSVSDLSPLTQLSSLQSLSCSSTSISDLAPLADLRRLEQIQANKCKVTVFPNGLLRDDPPIRLYMTSIEGIPPEILSQEASDDCRQRLIDHLQDLATGAEPVVDVKTLVMGNGRIGKTQICRRLRGQEYDEREDSTHGIIVTQAKLKSPGQLPATLSLWDFGGQDLYHGTHALFLKSRAIFLLVWTPHSEAYSEYEHNGMRFRNEPLPYWLNYIRNSASSGCPIVLVQNQCDTPADEVGQIPVDPGLLAPFYYRQVHFSAKEGTGRGSLNDAIAAAIHYLRGQEGIVTIGKGRMRVRQKLQKWLDQDAKREPERRQHRTLTQHQFRELCAEAGGVSSPASLLQYLHHAGIVFYQRNLFDDQIVLDQSWALDAIYTVFHREQCYRQLLNTGGRFTRSLLEMLAWGKYSPSEQELFLSMMQSCGICFQIRIADEKRQIEAEYAAPDLLPNQADVADELAGCWDESISHAKRAWSFKFLHAGLIRSVISHVGQQAAGRAIYWKYGVWFYDGNTRAKAIIHQEIQQNGQGKIILRTQGDRRAELLAVISKWIESGIEQFGIRSEAVEEDSLKTNRPDERQSDDRRMLPAIQFADPPSQQPKRFISYAWKDQVSSDPARAGKVDKFYERMKDAGHDVYFDKEQIKLNDRLSTFMRQVGQGDLVYIFLSDAYLKSPNCMYELLIIWYTCGDDPEEFRRRTRVYRIPGADVCSLTVQLNYAKYWMEKSNDLAKLTEEPGLALRIGPTNSRRLQQILEFATHVSEMLAQFADILQPASFDEFIDNAIAELDQGQP